MDWSKIWQIKNKAKWQENLLNFGDNISRIKSFILGYQKENSIEDLNLSIDLYLYTLASSMYCLQEKDWNDENKVSINF